MKLDSKENIFISSLSNEDFSPSDLASPSRHSGLLVQGQGPTSSDFYEEEESVIDTGNLDKENQENPNSSQIFITHLGPLRRIVLRENNSLKDLIYSRQTDSSPIGSVSKRGTSPQTW